LTTISLVLQTEGNSLLMMIKRITDLPLSDIKSRIQHKDPLMVVNYLNNDDIEKMRAFVLELLKNKANFKLYEHNDDEMEELPLEHFMNSFGLSRKIAEERERMDELLFDDDED
jgi:hypothetical protein